MDIAYHQYVLNMKITHYVGDPWGYYMHNTLISTSVPPMLVYIGSTNVDDIIKAFWHTPALSYKLR